MEINLFQVFDEKELDPIIRMDSLLVFIAIWMNCG